MAPAGKEGAAQLAAGGGDAVRARDAVRAIKGYWIEGEDRGPSRGGLGKGPRPWSGDLRNVWREAGAVGEHMGGVGDR